MTNFKGNYITCDDVKIAKNYLSEGELQRLNLLVSQFLDFAEFQALEQRSMKMNDWVAALDRQIVNLQRKLLEGKGAISHKQAMLIILGVSYVTLSKSRTDFEQVGKEL